MAVAGVVVVVVGFVAGGVSQSLREALCGPSAPGDAKMRQKWQEKRQKWLVLVFVVHCGGLLPRQ